MKVKISGTRGERTTKGAGPLALAAVLALALALSGCSFSFGGAGSPTGSDAIWTDSIPAGFSFATSRTIEIAADISVRVDGQTKPYSGSIGAYSFDAEAGYVLLGSATLAASDNGRASFRAIVPTDVETLTLRPSVMGLFDREIAISASTRSLSVSIAPDDASRATPAPASNRSIVAAGSASLYQTLSAFDSQGVPRDLEATREAFTQAYLDDIGASLPEYSKLPQVNPSFVDSAGKSNFAILESNAEIILTFIHEGAGYKNSLGYFVFDTANPPARASDIPASDMVVAFPNSSFATSGGNLKAGDRIKLWNPRTGTLKFSPGLSIGWFLLANGFNGTVTNGLHRFFSIPGANPEPASYSLMDRTHVAFLHNRSYVDAGKTSFLLAFEDMYRPSADNDFNDAVFSITVTPDTAVSTVDIPRMAIAKDTDLDGVYDSNDAFPEDPARAYIVTWPSAGTYGTAVFEDRWPSVGDYDFNDTVANVQLTTVKNARNEAVEMFVKTRLRAAGAGLPSGLALSLPVASASISSVTGQSLTSRLFDTAANGVEADSGNSVVPIFVNSHAEFGVAGSSHLIVNTDPDGVTKPEKAYEVKISFASGVRAENLVQTPDFFTVVNGVRGSEIHAIGKLPTAKANTGLFNTADDGSEAGNGQYYKSRIGAPWAMLIPAELPWAIERSGISTAYLKFNTWVRTGGSQFADWYQDKPGYRDASNLR